MSDPIDLDIELVGLPKTWIFTRQSNLAYDATSYMQRLDIAEDYLYLPAGQNLVEVTATDMTGAFLTVELTNADMTRAIGPEVSVTSVSQRIGAFPLDLGTDREKWIKIKARNVYTASIKNGRVAVKVMNFPLSTTPTY